jgi:hypothetical protein
MDWRSITNIPANSGSLCDLIDQVFSTSILITPNRRIAQMNPQLRRLRYSLLLVVRIPYLNPPSA